MIPISAFLINPSDILMLITDNVKNRPLGKSNLYLIPSHIQNYLKPSILNLDLQYLPIIHDLIPNK